MLTTTPKTPKKTQTFVSLCKMGCCHCKKEGHLMRHCPKKYPYVYGDKNPKSGSHSSSEPGKSDATTLYARQGEQCDYG